MPKKDPAYIKKAFLESLKKAEAQGKSNAFCIELLKIQDGREMSVISFDTLCYLALVNCGVNTTDI
jgi:hypothetical protein